MTRDIETRLRSALDATARAAVDDDRHVPPFLADIAEPTPAEPRRWAGPLLVAAAVAAVAVGAAVTVGAVRSQHHAPAGTSQTAPLPNPVPGTSAPPAPSVAHRSGSAAVSGSAGPHPSAAPAPFALGYQPLWPFRDLAEAETWRAAGHSSGVQPWHVDAGQTALAFTQGYLGLRSVDIVTSTTLDGDGAHIGVGYRDPNGAAHTSAVLHLVRFGPQSDAGWEVVGSDETTFSLEQPAYGSTVTSPLRAGGHITGVDESITVTVHQPSSGSASIGRTCCTPAGGNNAPWTVAVSFSGATDDVLTVLATTGGHLTAVERFAVQGVRSRP